MKSMTGKLLVCLALTVGMVTSTEPARAGECDGLKLCYKGALGSKGGKPTQWYISDKHPIPFWINASLLPAATRAVAVQAVKNAFAAYQLPCTSLKFTYAGAHTSFSDVQGGILVTFGNKTKDTGSWIHGNAAYWRYMNINSYQTGEISYGYIHLNAGLYGWNVGGTQVQAPPKATPHSIIDIKTAVMWIIPDLLGFLVSKDFTKSELPIAYKTQLKAPCPMHTTGAQFSYFKKTSASCTKPASVASCPGGFDPGDMGVLADGFYTDMPGRKDKGVWPTSDLGSPPASDSGVIPGLDGKGKACTSPSQCATNEVCTIDGHCQAIGGGDDGCSVAGGVGGGAGVLLVLAFLLGIRRRRS